MTKQKCSACGNTSDAGETMCSQCGTPYPVLVDAVEGVTIRKGQVIANRYVVLDMIGRGGMGCIYKVQDNTLGEIVALKTLLPEYVKDKVVVERFFNEARIARGLSHPHIVRVHDIGITDGMAYISMELLQGRTLRSMMDKVTPGRRIPLNAILRMFDALCAALDYAHEYTIHRDIKPENVMVLPNGTVKLMDFGISKLMSNPNLTSASMVMGTPHYMSPEQLKNSANVDARADIYSVGVMLYEILTGEIPTGISRSPDTIQEIPRSLDPVIAKCCNPNPAKRYQSIAELREQLRKIRTQVETHSSGGEEVSTKQPFVAQSGGNTIRRMGSALAMVLLAIAAYGALHMAEQRRQDVVVQVPESIPNLVESGVQNDATPVVRDTFAAMQPIVKRAQQQARSRLESLEGESYFEHASALVDEADEQWEGVEGLVSGWPVLHRYLAVLKWSEGMTFVPGGEVSYQLNGVETRSSSQAFFMDRREVSPYEFRDFCDKTPWRFPNGIKPNVHEMTNVTYYDAQAFLYSIVPRKQLPTVAQWALAVDSGNAYPLEEGAVGEGVTPLMLSINEWLYNENLPGTPESLFGVKMPYITGVYSDQDYVVAKVDSMEYEAFDIRVGFRGVLEFPTTLKEVEGWLE